MEKKVLVAYASRCGSTAEVAQAIGKALCAAGAQVDVCQVQDVKDLDQYQAVVLGSAARMGKLLSDATRFASWNQKILGQIPSAYFTVGITMREDTPENRKQASSYLEPLRQIRQPVSEGLFTGRVEYKRYRSHPSLDRTERLVEAAIEPITFIMESRMLVGIRDRAERYQASRQKGP